MLIKKVILQNFRNYDYEEFHFERGINIIIGNNAQGKTNLLESIFYISNLKSHRSSKEINLIKKNKQKAIIQTTIESNDTNYKIKLEIKNNEKKIMVDNNKKKQKEYKKIINTVIFFPEDLDIIKGYEDVRRDYLNHQLSNLSDDYKKTIYEYNKLLKMKNEWFKRKRSGVDVDYEYLNVLNDYFAKKAVNLYIARNKYIKKINSYIADIFKSISLEDNLKIDYITQVNLQMEKSLLIEEVNNKISENSKEEELLGKTIFGPHKDELVFNLSNNSLREIGSQGQQRMCVLSYKLAELLVYEEITREKSILLLDDVFSELDFEKQKNILKLITKYDQIIITTTDINNIKIDKKNINIIKIKEGTKEKVN